MLETLACLKSTLYKYANTQIQLQSKLPIDPSYAIFLKSSWYDNHKYNSTGSLTFNGIRTKIYNITREGGSTDTPKSYNLICSRFSKKSRLKAVFKLSLFCWTGWGQLVETTIVHLVVFHSQFDLQYMPWHIIVCLSHHQIVIWICFWFGLHIFVKLN